jgi:predicted metalloprotease with PDZ domain
MQRVCETAAGGSLDDFFRRFVRGRDPLDYNAGLNAVGLRLQTEAPNSGAKPHLGADLANDSSKLMVRRVYAATAAYEQGLNTGDEIIALNGWRVTLDQFNKRMAEKKPGESITLTLFRAEELRTLTIKLGGRVDPDYRILAMANPTPAQQSLYQSWMGKTLGE